MCGDSAPVFNAGAAATGNPAGFLVPIILVTLVRYFEAQERAFHPQEAALPKLEEEILRLQELGKSVNLSIDDARIYEKLTRLVKESLPKDRVTEMR